MKTKIYVALTMVLVLIVFAVGTASAQGPQPPRPPEQPGIPETSSPWEPALGKPFARPGAAAMGVQNVGATSISLGQPGLSFRYVQTFGVTREPFVETDDHFYWVEGIGTVGNNVWIGDYLAHRVVKFDSSGNFVAKIGKAGVIDYTGTALMRITDVAEDSSGNVWVVDAEASHVVKYDSSGNKVGELGQAWSPGSANNRFENPIGIAFDGAGNIYISDSGYWGSDYGNNRVQVFDSGGNYLATIGGACGTGNTQLCWPRRIAVYGNRLYVADADNHRVQIFDISNPSAPTYTATLGQTGSPGAGNNQFNTPQGVAVDANYIYVADTENHRVQVFNRNTLAYVATIGGSYGTGNNQFKYPTDVAVDAAGNIYVADFGNKRVQQFSSSLVYQRTYGTTGDSYVESSDRFYYPEGVAVGPDGSIYVVEGSGYRLVKLNADGVPQWTVGEAGQPGNDNAHFSYLHDVAIGPDGRIYTVEAWGSVPYMSSGNHRLQIFNPDGSYYGGFGGYGGGNYQFIAPHGIAFDRNGNLYIADTGNHRVQIYNSQFVYVATLGVTGVSGSDNAHFNNPNDVAVDKDGYIYVADEGNDRVQVFDANRNYVRTIGGGGTGNDFGHFSGWGPHHIAVDSQGRLYVVDSGNSRVQVFDNYANGNAYLTTIGGAGGTPPGRFSNVIGIAVGPDDSVYTTETDNNHRIQKFAPGVPGWKQVNINGFGDRTNGNIHTLAAFGGQLYAGTYNSAGGGAQLWRMSAGNVWDQPITAGFGITRNVGLNHLVTFKSQLYAGVRNDTGGASIYRSSDGSTWDPVVTGGFDSVQNTGVYRFAVFNNQLYAGTSSWTAGRGGEIWRSSSGDAGTWERVVAAGFDDPNNYIMRSSEVHNGYLYFGTQNVDTSNYMTTTGGIIIRSSTGDSGSWTKVTPNGLGDINNYAISGLASFNGYLYASTSRWDWSGVQVWRCQNCDGSDWEKVVDNGFDNPNNWGISTLQVFSGELYLVIGNGITGIEVWRTQTGNLGEWMKVSDGGFGDSNNSSPYYNNVTVFNNRLYIGTQNGANGPEVWKKTVTADFSASPTVGAPGATVTFTNLSSGDFTSATWDFGDGSPPVQSNAPIVQHTYSALGTYTVTLTVSAGVDMDVKARPVYIQITHQLFLPLVERNYNPLMALYDDFNNPAYDGFYNPIKWRFWGNSNYFSAQQQNGVLIITNTPSTPADVGLDLPLAVSMERTIRQIQRFQARLKLSSGTNGTGAKIQIMSDVNGSGWWVQCSLHVYGSQPDFGCDITNYTPGNYQAEYGVGWPYPLNFDTWYTARIEIDPNTAQICFYLDDNQLGCHVPNDAAALKSATNLVSRIGSWNGGAGATGTRYFDDVYITPAGP